MIAADVVVGELDAEPWGELCAAVLRRRRETPWAYVLHSSGRVVATVPQAAAGLNPGDPLQEPQSVAELVRAATGRVRAVVIDRDALPDLVRTATGLARRDQPLPELRAGIADAYWSSPGVVTSPAARTAPWQAMSDHLRSRGERLEGLIALVDGDRVVLALEVVVQEGLITSVRSRTLPDAAAADATGRSADVYLRCSWSAALRALAEPDAHDAAADLLDTGATGHGFDGAADLLRGVRNDSSKGAP